MLMNIPLVKWSENIILKKLLEEVYYLKLFHINLFIIYLVGSFGAIYMVSDNNSSKIKAVKCFFKGDEKV
jgi:hypothetical protein